MAIHPKYQALAEKVHLQRLEQLKQIHPFSDASQGMPFDLDEKRSQLSFLFAKNQNNGLDVFQHYDSESRYIEWSFYSAEGEFLLQFGFSLNEVLYSLHSVNPELHRPSSPLGKYLRVIKERLKRHPKVLEFLDLYLKSEIAV
jgi:hypothetical protein